jgi:hypothetical protein
MVSSVEELDFDLETTESQLAAVDTVKAWTVCVRGSTWLKRSSSGPEVIPHAHVAHKLLKRVLTMETRANAPHYQGEYIAELGRAVLELLAAEQASSSDPNSALSWYAAFIALRGAATRESGAEFEACFKSRMASIDASTYESLLEVSLEGLQSADEARMAVILDCLRLLFELDIAGESFKQILHEVELLR